MPLVTRIRTGSRRASARSACATARDVRTAVDPRVAWESRSHDDRWAAGRPGEWMQAKVADMYTTMTSLSVRRYVRATAATRCATLGQTHGQQLRRRR